MADGGQDPEAAGAAADPPPEVCCESQAAAGAAAAPAQDDDPPATSTGLAQQGDQTAAVQGRVTGSSWSPGNVYLLSYAFNQDQSCFTCGTTAGFRTYTASPLTEVNRREHKEAFQHRSVVLIAMLFKTNIFAMVTISDEDPSNGGRNKVLLWDERKGKFVGELRHRNEVKSVVLRRDIIAIVCEYTIYVYTFDKLRVILHLTTKANPRGLCVLAVESDPWILCCPGQSTGALRVQVGQDDRATHVFMAHQTGLAALAVNTSGTLVATASEKGTVVKVFQASDGQLLYRLRRGKQPAVISCLTFRPDDRFLAVASSSSTVHIFKLDNASRQQGEQSQEPYDNSSSPELRPSPSPESLASQIQKEVAKVVRSYSGVMPEYFNDVRSFAHFRIPDVDANGQPTVDARSKQARIQGPQLAFHEGDRLFVLHYSGVLYECSFKADHDPCLGTQDCGFVCATTWFAVRPDFKVQGERAAEAEGDEEWQLL